MKLYAVSDLHLDFKVNRQALKSLPAMTSNDLITGGDLCSSLDHLRETWDVLRPRFRELYWVPGNHELWSSRIGAGPEMLQGQEKYEALVSVCREYGVHTPEDPFPSWPDEQGDYVIAPLFMLYDYSYRPDDVALEDAVAWAMEAGVLCSDEKLIQTKPYASMIDWCNARYEESIRRLSQIEPSKKIILVNHFPLRHDLVRIKRIPRFSIWCGTKLTEELHRRYNIEVVITGHLHMRATDYRDNVRFEEVSLGYPRDWDQEKGVGYYLREILPGPVSRPEGDGPFWRFF